MSKMSKEAYSILLGIGVEIIFGILGITVKDMPMWLAIVGYILGGLFIVYGAVGLCVPSLRISFNEDKIVTRKPIMAGDHISKKELRSIEKKMKKAQKTNSYNSPPLEYLDREMDFKILGYEIFDTPNANLLLVIVNTMITNTSSTAKNILAYMTYEFRATDKQEMTTIHLIPYEPLDNWVADLKTKFETERQVSLGNYLKFPLLLEPQKSLKGFMLLATFDKKTFDKFTDQKIGGPPVPIFATFETLDSRIYLEWENLITGNHFRMKFF